MNDNPHIGESFESFLRDEGICEEVTAEAVRRASEMVIEWKKIEFPQQGRGGAVRKE